MAIPSTIADLSTTSASNYPQSSDSVGAAIYQLPQAISAIIKKQFIAGSDITVSSSGSVTIPVENCYITIQGTGFNITGFSDCFNGRVVTLRFASAGLTLVHSASLQLPGSANITTGENDVSVFVNESVGVWRCAAYLKADGTVSTTTVNAATSVTTPKVDTSQGANIASASTINLETATGQYVIVTGTTAITGITLSQGHIRVVVFSGVLTLTNSVNLVLPGGADITTANGDIACFVGGSGGTVRCVSYTKADGKAVVVTPTQVKNGVITKTLTDASGTLDVTGLGFTPRLIRFTEVSYTLSGSYAAGTNTCIYTVLGGSIATDSNCIHLERSSPAGSQTAVVSAVAPGQFTLTWTKTGSPTGTAYILWEAIG
jgi:hypothetical protein